jgi:hypothetical protein
MFNRLITFALLVVAVSIIACDSETTTEPVERDIYIVGLSSGQTLTEPVTLTVWSETGLVFESVDFYIDGNLIFSDPMSPFQYYWNIFDYSSSGNHQVYVVGHVGTDEYTSSNLSVSVSVETGLTYMGTYQPNSQQTDGVSVSGNLMFAAVGSEGVEVIDISSKSAPDYISRYDSPGLARKTCVDNPYVYIADESAGVTRTLITSADTLSARGVYNTPGQARDVAVGDNYLYVADFDGLLILDISDPNNLSFINNIALQQVNYVIARHDTVYLTNISGVHIYDCTNPNSPAALDAFITSGNAQSVAVMDSFLFVADGVEGVRKFSISDPTDIILISTYDVQGASVSTVYSGGSAVFAGTTSGNIIALDYESAEQMSVLDSYVSTAASVSQVYYYDYYLFAATSDGVLIFRYL